jgi:hypothetical protein
VPKKVFTFDARVARNMAKGGGWLATVKVSNDQDDVSDSITSAWKNASAAKKWVKEQVQKLTPRKSVKLIAGPELDDKDKPTRFTGSLTYRDPK